MDWLEGIEAVTFDVGGTLIEPWPSVGEVYAEVAARHGCKDVSPEVLNRQFRAAWKAKANFDHSREAWRRLVEATFAGVATLRAGHDLPTPPSLGERTGKPPHPGPLPLGEGEGARNAGSELFEELYRHFGTAKPWRVFEDVFPALDRLRQQGLKLGVISNWDERLRPLLEELGLSRFFEAMIISCEAGCCKPAPEIFRQALAKLNVKAGAALHVGDSVEADVEGARGVGMRAVLVERRGAVRKAGSVSSLRELTGSLDNPFQS